MKKIFLFILLLMFCLVLNSCEFGQTTTINEEPDDMQYQIYKLAKASSYTGTYEEWLESIRGDEVELKSQSGFLMWKYKSEYDSNWRILYDFTLLKGEKGDTGEQGKSAYELALENGFVGTLDEWLESLKGKDCDYLSQGKSAYELFKENYPEYTGTEKEWVTAIAKNDVCALFGHEWDEGVITTDAQVGVNGEKTYTCKVCGEHKYEVIPMIVPVDAEIYTEGGINYVNFGKYPQTHVSDENIINALNTLTETNGLGYYEYNGNEYAKIYAQPCESSYIDNFGETQYYKYSDGAHIQNNTTEYFLVEPIKWRVLGSTNGEYLIISDRMIDQSVYYINQYDRRIDDEVIYANNYKYSTIREYLNNDFYNTAFNSSQKNAIIVTEVDNSAVSTTFSANQYVCENTFDKIFLLSYKEANELFDNDQSRQAKTTDYAIAKGSFFGYYFTPSEYYGNGEWWLRSPYYSDGDYACGMNSEGNSVHGIVGRCPVFSTYLGVRPACKINLQ